MIPGRIIRRVPYLYSGEETAQLMAAARALPSPVLAASMRTLIGLLASTGIRSGEAFALDAGDLDIAGQVLTATGKYGRKRLIALHPSAAAALSGYLRFREQHAAGGTAALLMAGPAAPQRQHGAQDLPVAGRRMRPGAPARLRFPEAA